MCVDVYVEVDELFFETSDCQRSTNCCCHCVCAMYVMCDPDVSVCCERERERERERELSRAERESRHAELEMFAASLCHDRESEYMTTHSYRLSSLALCSAYSHTLRRELSSLAVISQIQPSCEVATHRVTLIFKCDTISATDGLHC